MKIAIAKDTSTLGALKETDPNKLIYSSDYDTLKYFMSGTVTVTVSGATATGSVNHDLGYSPFFLAYVVGFGGANKYNLCPGYVASFSGYIHADAYIDATTLYFRVHTNYFSGTQQFLYKIFRNRLSI